MDFTVSAIRASCEAAVNAATSSGLFSLDAAALGAFAAMLPAADAATEGSGVTLPLRYDSVDDEIDAALFRVVLEFGSGYRAELHAATGAGASDTMLRGTLAWFLSGHNARAEALRDATPAALAEACSFPMDISVPVRADLPCVTIDRPGPLRPLADLLAGALTSCGAALINRGARSFASFLRAQGADKAFHAPDGTPHAGRLVTLLASTFPTFRDVHVVPHPCGGGAQPLTVVILKKAQLAVKELGRLFGSRVQQLFAFPPSGPGSVSEFTACADNVLPAVLVRAGVLVLSPPLHERIARGEPLEGDGTDTLLRAAAVVICALLVARVNEARGGAPPLTEARLDFVLWRMGKLPQWRDAPRHVGKGTQFY